MSVVATVQESMEWSRGRTLDLLGKFAEADALAWRPGAGRAHAGWQFMHVAVTEAIFASERLAPEKSPVLADLWPRFRGGSTPDDDVPTADQLREALEVSRNALFETLADYGDDRLGEIPPTMTERGWDVRTILNVLQWHEAHHQGQAHLTLNLFKACSG